MKIKNQLLLTHGLLVLLAIAIVLINVMVYINMDNDAAIVNQSGKLRMLSYNMSQIANRLDHPELNEDLNALKLELNLRVQEFDAILLLLSKENAIEITHDPSYVKYERISKEWNEFFKPSYIEIIQSEIPLNHCEVINNRVDAFVANVNEMVTLYSEFAREKVILALVVNGGLVFVILLVTLYSFVSTNNRIRKPMKVLMEELKELSLIDDSFSNRLKAVNSDEITEMTHYFNEMMFDVLTSAFNRRAGLAKLSKLIQYSKRENTLSLCFIDINGLKDVNDYLGHKYGDELIVSVVSVVQNEIRENDFIVRMGGDEFLIVFYGVNSVGAEKVWQRINSHFEKVNHEEERPYLISVSHGIVEFDHYKKSEIESLIK